MNIYCPHTLPHIGCNGVVKRGRTIYYYQVHCRLSIEQEFSTIPQIQKAPLTSNDLAHTHTHKPPRDMVSEIFDPTIQCDGIKLVTLISNIPSQ